MQKVSEACLPPLVQELRDTISDAHCPTTLVEMIEDALRQPGHTLAAPPSMKWPLLVLTACQSASADEWQHALPAAASFEFLAVALEIIDDLQDGDQGPLEAKYGAPQALNVAYELLMLSQCAMWRLSRGSVPPETRIAVAEVLSQAAATAGNGQHLDLLYETRSEVSHDECLQVASQKSALLVSAAFRVGAMLGTVDQSLVEKYAEMGWHLGMYAQLVNDIEDVLPGRTDKSDIERGKKTLPLLFGLDGRNSGNGGASLADDAVLRDALWKTGALHYAWTIAELHREKAKEIADQLDHLRNTEPILSPLTEAKHSLF